jgi:hypothetical protein
MHRLQSEEERIAAEWNDWLLRERLTLADAEPGHRGLVVFSEDARDRIRDAQVIPFRKAQGQ